MQRITATTVEAYRVPLNAGGYDPIGRYFGRTELPLYCLYPKAQNGIFEAKGEPGLYEVRERLGVSLDYGRAFVRAESAKEARTRLSMVACLATE